MFSPTILIHFATARQKKLFYSLYLNKMPLNPTKFGLPAENAIVIGENLTKKNAQLFKSAQILRKNKRIAQTCTEDGIVKIRFVKGKKETTFTVRGQTQLEMIVAQYEHTLTQPHGQSSTNTIATEAMSSNEQHTFAEVSRQLWEQQRQQHQQHINAFSNGIQQQQRYRPWQKHRRDPHVPHQAQHITATDAQTDAHANTLTNDSSQLQQHQQHNSYQETAQQTNQQTPMEHLPLT